MDPKGHVELPRPYHAASILAFYVPFLNLHIRSKALPMTQPALHSLHCSPANLSSGILLCQVHVVASLCISSFGLLQKVPTDKSDVPL